MTIRELLIRQYYDGKSVAGAAEHIERCYQERVTERQIKNAKKSIKDCTRVDWV